MVRNRFRLSCELSGQKCRRRDWTGNSWEETGPRHGCWKSRGRSLSRSRVQPAWFKVLQSHCAERFTVTIDYPKRSIKIEEPSDYNYTGPGVQVPLEFKGPLPYARATIHIQGNPPVEDLFLVDSGSSDEVDHPLIAKSRAGTETAPGGIGLGTPIEARLGRVDLLELGPFKIRGATGIATESGLGSRLIGAGVLSRFKVIFDYQRSRMFLEEETGQ